MRQVGRVGMHLGERGGAHAELVAAGDQRDELGGPAQAVGVRCPLLLPARRIAAQRQHVVDPGPGDLVQHLPQPVHRLAHAAQVRHRLDAQLLLDPLGDLDRPLAGRPAGAVGHRDEVGLQAPQRAQRLAQGALALGRLGREELEREDGLLGRRDDLVDPHRAIVAAPLSRSPGGAPTSGSPRSRGSPVARRAARPSPWPAARWSAGRARGLPAGPGA